MLVSVMPLGERTLLQQGIQGAREGGRGHLPVLARAVVAMGASGQEDVVGKQEQKQQVNQQAGATGQNDWKE
eukprot:11214999-Lingulodinium_polyedra.AAC.1